MRVPRFLVESLPDEESRQTLVPLPPEVGHHLVRVLRLGPGAIIGLFDGAGQEARAVVEHGPEQNPSARVTTRVQPADRDAPVRIAAFSAPKGERLERLVEQATELGVSELVLVLFGRTPPRARSPRPERLRKIAACACSQCGRARLPSIRGPMPLAEFLARVDLPAERILLDPSGPPLASAPPTAATLLVGPEGGLETHERTLAEAAGFVSRNLGGLTLRVETAVLAALARLTPA